MEQNLKAIHFAINYKSIRILTVLSKQNKFLFYWLLLNFIKSYFHFLCFVSL